MKSPLVISLLLASACIGSLAVLNCGMQTASGSEVVEPAPAGVKPGKTMKPFGSADEMKKYFAKLAESTERMRRAEQKSMSANGNTATSAPAPSTADSAAEQESITNTQHAGIDEGGIVKLHGEHLVILRRGRLFTVKVGDDSLKPVAAIDAFAPGIDPSNDWYDEMLVSRDTVIVIGYSYGRGGTEINLFDINDAGSLAYRSTYHMRSNDYYSSRNYASRLIGDKLIFYTPQYFGYYGDPMERMPAVRRWKTGSTDRDFMSIVPPTRMYMTPQMRESGSPQALHTVTVCDLANRGFDCKGTAVLGSPGRVFYVSPDSVYVWTTDWNYTGEPDKNTSASMLYRMPLDGSAPTAVGVKGSPIDQFSFLESSDGRLNVLVTADGRGDQMWGSELSSGDIALLRFPLESFSDGSSIVPDHRYRNLPKPEGYTFQNRFVGNYLLYGTGSGWGRSENKRSADLFAVNWTNGDVSELKVQSGVDRIEQMGKDAVVVGTNGEDLYFTPIKLDREPQISDPFVRKNAAQGELRSHGFFYRSTGDETGYLGLPIARGGRAGYRHLVEDSAAVLFLKNDSLAFTELGELEGRNTDSADGCKASCVDWYGNARPLFINGRVLALLGYEIVEGNFSDGRITEKRRMNYSPRAMTLARGAASE